MRWIILTLSLSLLMCSAFSQVTIQGTVTASADETAALSDASVQFIKLDINGRDTVRVVLGTVQTDQSGHFSYLLATDVQTTRQNVPKQFALSASYPNPFQTRTQIGLDVSKPDDFTIAVYNILGQEVAHLEKVLSVGSYSIQWDGSAIPGVYFVVVKAGGDMRYIKLVQLQRNTGASALSITGASSQVRASLANAQALVLASNIQLTVSKPLYQTYTSSVLTYTNQSLTVPLTYVGSQSISPSKRDSSLAETAAQFASFRKTLSKDDAAKAMADWLKKRPEFEAMGTEIDGNVWFRFTDGGMAIIANNRAAARGTQSPLHKIAGVPLLKTDSDPSTNIPSYNKWLSCETLGAGFLYTGPDYLDVIAPLVGYVPSHLGSVGELKTLVNDAAIFFLDGHGGYGKAPWGGTEYAVWTKTKRSVANDTLFSDDLRQHRLVWMYADYDTTTTEWHYAFTGQFVRKYMSFAKNSLVYIDACWSATNNVFVNSFIAKGASVYAGYSAPAEAYSSLISTLVFFDRTLGANSPLVDIEIPKPPQRAFDWPAVFSWMHSKNLDFGSSDGITRLVVVPSNGSKLGPLAPSIATMSVHPYDQKLYIYGLFGENPGGDGVVMIGGSPTQIYEWAYDGTAQMDRIVCKIPDDGAGSYGDVQVKVHEIKSNTTQLSRYKGNFTLVHETNDGRRYEVKLTLQFRVHLLGFRMKPGEKPMFNQPNYCVYADMGSKGEYTASGSTGGQVFWTGHATDLHNNIDGAAAERSYEAGAWFDPEQKKMQLYMSGGIKDGIIQTMGSTSTPMLIIYGVDEFDGKHGYLPSYVEIPLQPNFSITKDKRSGKKVATYYSMLGPMMDTVRIEWDDITCEAPPKEDTAR